VASFLQSQDVGPDAKKEKDRQPVSHGQLLQGTLDGVAE
jgi:hypothetical protein